MNFLKILFNKVSKDNIVMHAAALALSAAFSTSPLIIQLYPDFKPAQLNLSVVQTKF